MIEGKTSILQLNKEELSLLLKEVHPDISFEEEPMFTCINIKIHGKRIFKLNNCNVMEKESAWNSYVGDGMVNVEKGYSPTVDIIAMWCQYFKEVVEKLIDDAK